jgi:hypothetical protein
VEYPDGDEPIDSKLVPIKPCTRKECCKCIDAELQRPLVGLKTEKGKELPESRFDYLTRIANDGVWVEGDTKPRTRSK